MLFIYSRCGPCQRMAPVFDSFATKYPQAVFLKIDVDECHETAASQNVSAMPTFIFFKNKVPTLPNHQIFSSDSSTGMSYFQDKIYHKN